MVGWGGEVPDEYRSNGAGMGNDVQYGGLDGAALQERELGSDRVDAEVDGRVPPLGGSEDIRDTISSRRGGGMLVVIGDGVLGGSGGVLNKGIYLEASGYHCII